MEVEGYKAVIDFFLGLGAPVLLPLILFFLALIFRAPPGKAFRSSLMFGVGFIGLNLVIGLLMNQIGPVSKGLVGRFGLQLDIIDVGWPAAASIAFGSKISIVTLPIDTLHSMPR